MLFWRWSRERAEPIECPRGKNEPTALFRDKITLSNFSCVCMGRNRTNKYFYEVNIFPIFERAVSQNGYHKKSIYFIYVMRYLAIFCNKGTNCTHVLLGCKRSILEINVATFFFFALSLCCYRFICHLVRFVIVLDAMIGNPFDMGPAVIFIWINRFWVNCSRKSSFGRFSWFGALFTSFQMLFNTKTFRSY